VAITSAKHVLGPAHPRADLDQPVAVKPGQLHRRAARQEPHAHTLQVSMDFDDGDDENEDEVGGDNDDDEDDYDKI
jgi:hypothetical protein